MDKIVRDKLEAFVSTYKTRRVKKGEMLITAGQTPSGVIYLRKGVVRRYAVSKSGDELVLNVFKPISFFPMSWVLNNAVSDHYFETITACEIVIAPKEELYLFLEKNPDVIFDLLKRIYRGLEGYMLKMEYLMSGSASAKLLVELYIQALRLGEKVEGGTQVQVIQKDLAAQMGIARETVSRELQKLDKKGIIKLQSHSIIIPSIERLKEEMLQN